MAYSLTYTLNSDGVSYSVTGYSNITASDKVVIPDKYNDGTHGEHPVTSIGNGAFWGCSNLTSVTIGNSVTSISDYAFRNCSSLTSVTIPDSVTSINNGGFSFCSSLTSVTIGNGVTSIGHTVFYDCSSLTSVTIGNGVTSIDYSAFGNCTELTQLILFPSTPPTLGSSAIPANIQSIYVQQSSKAAYQAATNWTTFASKIVSDNMYLSFVRFNQKNKEYIGRKIDEKVNNKLTAPTTPTADSVVTMAANGTTGTKPLSEFSGKLYKHETSFNTSNEQYYSFSIITGESAAYTLDTLDRFLAGGAIYYGTAGEYGGVIWNYDTSTHILSVNGGSAEFTLTSITDIVREL